METLSTTDKKKLLLLALVAKKKKKGSIVSKTYWHLFKEKAAKKLGKGKDDDDDDDGETIIEHPYVLERFNLPLDTEPDEESEEESMPVPVPLPAPTTASPTPAPLGPASAAAVTAEPVAAKPAPPPPTEETERRADDAKRIREKFGSQRSAYMKTTFAYRAFQEMGDRLRYTSLELANPVYGEPIGLEGLLKIRQDLRDAADALEKVPYEMRRGDDFKNLITMYNKVLTYRLNPYIKDEKNHLPGLKYKELAPKVTIIPKPKPAPAKPATATPAPAKPATATPAPAKKNA